MTNKPHQPRLNEVLLGRPSSPPRTALLGGLEGEKPRRTHKSEGVTIAALSQALKYGKPGKNWIYQIVKTQTGPVQWAAYDLLWESLNERARQQLLKYSPLRSEVGVDYTRLRNLLALGEWEEADRETKAVMLKAAGREKEGLLDREAIEQFPGVDLRTIDQLWVKYSKGRFGFSVQKRIWKSVVRKQKADTETSGNQRVGANEKEGVNQFGERVGWRVEGNWLNFTDLTFNLCAPEGHLPSPSFAVPCDVNTGEEQEVLGRWCTAFCFGGVRCGVLFLGWWSVLSRPDL